MSTHRYHIKKNRGFTLAEMLVVLCIVAFLAAIMIPMIHVRNYNKEKSRTFSHGRYECFIGDDGKLYEYKEDEKGAAVTGYPKVAGGYCQFVPEKKKIAFYTIMAIGKGSDGTSVAEPNNTAQPPVDRTIIIDPTSMPMDFSGYEDWVRDGWEKLTKAGTLSFKMKYCGNAGISGKSYQKKIKIGGVDNYIVGFGGYGDSQICSSLTNVSVHDGSYVEKSVDELIKVWTLKNHKDSTTYAVGAPDGTAGKDCIVTDSTTFECATMAQYTSLTGSPLEGTTTISTSFVSAPKTGNATGCLAGSTTCVYGEYVEQKPNENLFNVLIKGFTPTEGHGGAKLTFEPSSLTISDGRKYKVNHYGAAGNTATLQKLLLPFLSKSLFIYFDASGNVKIYDKVASDDSAKVVLQALAAPLSSNLKVDERVYLEGQAPVVAGGLNVRIPSGMPLVLKNSLVTNKLAGQGGIGAFTVINTTSSASWERKIGEKVAYSGTAVTQTETDNNFSCPTSWSSAGKTLCKAGTGTQAAVVIVW